MTFRTEEYIKKQRSKGISLAVLNKILSAMKTSH